MAHTPMRLAALGALACLLAVAPAGRAQDGRVRLTLPAGGAPVSLSADAVSRWDAGGLQVFALEGAAVVEQGEARVRAARMVVWTDPRAAEESRLTRVTVVTDGETRLESAAAKPQVRGRATVEMGTTGELRVRSRARKIELKSREGEDWVRAAMPAAGAASPVRPASLREAANDPPEPDPVPAPSGNIDPVPPRPASPPPGRTSPPPLPNSPFPEPEDEAPLERAPGGPDRRTNPVFPRGIPQPAPAAPPQAAIAMPSADASRVLQIAPRFGVPYNLRYLSLPSGEQALVVTGGVILTARSAKGEGAGANGTIDIEADRLVVWTRGNTQELFEQMRSAGGSRSEGGREGERQVEFYLTGNVQIRYGTGPDRRVLYAKQVYYDVNSNKALAIDGEIELYSPLLPTPARVKAGEIQQLSPEEFHVYQAEISASQLPSDPSLILSLDRAKVQQRRKTPGLLPSLFGAEEETETERVFTGRHLTTTLLGVPVFYTPYAYGNVEDPLGPLNNFAFRQDQVYGTQALTTLDAYQLLGLDAPKGHRWNLYLDWLSERGFGTGTGYNYSSRTLFGEAYDSIGKVRGYYLHDDGKDQLGGARDSRRDAQPRDTDRGRFFWQHMQELPSDFQYMGQISYLSDKNYLESYQKLEFDMAPNQETFGYLKWQPGTMAATLLVQQNWRDWVTETSWLPRADAYWLGVSPLELFTYNAHASAGYARSTIPDADKPNPPLFATEAELDTSRVNLWQELSLPFQAGPVKLAPYGVVDLTHYSQDLTGEQRGRFYGGGGVRGTMPLSRLYPGVESELLNLNGIHHKVELFANYFAAYSDTPYSRLPQLDRLDDDATDQSRRDITPRQNLILGEDVGTTLQTAPYFDPQRYAIRRLVDNRVDTLDSIQVVQTAVRQRLQTKRGYPGMEHITDWLTFDLSASFFPDPDRDNFGEPVSFLEYNAVWNVGDRTGVVSSGWFDPFEHGARYWSLGGYYDRTDATRLSLMYRQFDPVNSKAVTASVAYAFSPKYSFAAGTTYDFGLAQALSNQFVLTRRGTDMIFRVGFSYEAFVQNFGFTVELVPLAFGSSRLLSPTPSVLGR